MATPRAYSPTRPRESTGCTAGREGVVLVLEASPKSCEDSPDWDHDRLPVGVAGRVPRRVARRILPDAPMPPPHASCNTLGEIVNISRVRICQDSLEKWPVAYQSQHQIGAMRVWSRSSSERAYASFA